METYQKPKRGGKIVLFVLSLILGISIGILGTLLTIRYYSSPEFQLAVDTTTALNNIKDTINTSMNEGGKYGALDEMWAVLKNNYYYQENLDFNKSIEEAKKGFIDAIGDPFTTYFNKQEASDFSKDLQGTDNFEGVGAVVSKKADGIQVEELIKGSPAFKGGLKPLDLITEVNGESIKGQNLNEVVSKKIRGPKGSEVELTIFRESENKVFKVKLVRDNISVPSVSGKILELTGGNKVGYIEISKFGEDTEKLMEDTISELRQTEVKGIVLDLRGNGGGIVNIAVEIASHFIPKDKVIVETRYKSAAGEMMKSNGYGEYEGKPIVILVDGLTASASEIIAGALSQQAGAKLIGTKTFGKGSIQTIYTFKDGSSFKYTVGRWYMPDGKTIDKVGIEPDIKIDADLKLYDEQHIDNQLEKAKEELSKMIK